MKMIVMWFRVSLKSFKSISHGVNKPRIWNSRLLQNHNSRLLFETSFEPRNQLTRIPGVLLIFIVSLTFTATSIPTPNGHYDSSNPIADDVFDASASWTADMVYWLDAQDLDGDGTAEGTAGESGQSAGQVSTWVNKAGVDNFTNTAGTTPGTLPDLKENQINFNPAIHFNESVLTDYLAAAVTKFPASTITQFLVMKTLGDGQGMFSYATSVRENGFLLIGQNNLAIWHGQKYDFLENDFNNNEAVILAVDLDRSVTTSVVNVFQNSKDNNGNPYSFTSLSLGITGTVMLAQDQDFVGGFNQSSQAYVGQLAEVITYSKVLSDLERQSAESYLAIKYGITLDQATGTDYLASNQIAIWDYSENTTYINDIAGIGRDDDSDLDQPKSKSENTDAILTIEAAGSMTDDRYLMWGNDNASTIGTSVFNQDGVNHDLMDRTWRIQEKSSVDAGSGIGTAADFGLVNVSFDLTGVTYDENRVRLRAGQSGVFTVLPTIPSINNDQVTFSGIDLSDGMTLALIVDFTPKLSFTTQPTTTLINETINQGLGIGVDALDANDAVLSSFMESITLSIGTDPSSGTATLTGTLTRAATNGQVIFDNISLDVLGEGFTLQATAPESTSGTSSSFNIQEGGPGGISDGLLYWLDAHDLDADVSAEGVAGESGQTSGQVSTWTNKTGGTNFTITSGQSEGSTPDLKENQINFNEAIEFNEFGTSDYLGAAVSDFPSSGITQFVVFTSTGTQDGIFSYATSTRDNEFLLFAQENLRTYAKGSSRLIGDDLNNGGVNILTFDRLSVTRAANSFVNNLGHDGNSYTLGTGNFENTGTIILAQDQDNVGGGFQPGQAFKGQMAEVITYSKVLSTIERQSVESYLAIKYGITLDQTSGTDYLASNQVAVWDYSENTAYIHDIAGIGRDKISVLSQPKSRSENSDAILTIEAAGALTNGRFLFWSNNNGSLTTTSSSSINGVDSEFMNRTWRIQEKSMVDAGANVGSPEDFDLVNVSFDLTGITYNPDRVRLWTFGAGGIGVSGISPTVINDQVTFSGVDLSDGLLMGLIVDFTPKLAFSTQPTNTLINNTINAGSGVALSALDVNDEIVSSFSESIILSLSNDPSSGSVTLAGTLSRAAIDGIATFDDISLDVLGEGYTLQAASTGLSSVISSGFDIQNSGPGGVIGGLLYWLDAHDLDADGSPEGTAGETGQTSGQVSSWSNKAGGIDFTNTAGQEDGSTPDLKEAQINFNEAIEYNESETTDYLGAQVTDFPTATITQFLVVKTPGSGDGMFSYAVTGSDNEFLIDEQESLLFTVKGVETTTGITLNDGRPNILSIDRTSSSGVINIYTNAKAHSGNPSIGTTGALLSTGTIILAQEQDNVGGGFQTAQAYQGQLAEVITYSEVLSAADHQSVESYLAIKYGVTLDQTNGTDYLASNQVAVWDYSENSTYVHDIAGIGRDDLSSLNQKQSKSINSDAIVTIGLDNDINPDGLETTNVLNDGSFSTDRTFLIWSNDGATIDDGTGNEEFDPNSGINSRLNREWRIQETGTIGTVTVEFDISAIAGPTGVGTNDESQIQLLVDEDGDFSGGNQALVPQFLMAPADGLVRFRVDFSDGNYFTLVSAEQVALSVELVSFEAKLQSNHVLLEWATASESNGTIFRVERATGDLNFKTIATIAGGMVSSALKSYRFQDSEPQRGNNYYRLIDINEQGIESVSEIINIYYSKEDTTQFLVYPNPVQKGRVLYINTEIQSLEGTVVFLITSIGRLLTPKLSIDAANKHLVLETENLMPGIYMLRLITRDGSTVQYSKFMVKD